MLSRLMVTLSMYRSARFLLKVCICGSIFGLLSSNIVFAQLVDSCEVDSIQAEHSIRKFIDSLNVDLQDFEDMGFYSLVTPQEWIPGVIIGRAITAANHWRNAYIAYTCSGNLYIFPYLNSDGYWELMQEVLERYDFEIPAQEIFDGYVNYVLEINPDDIVTEDNIDSVRIKTGYECLELPVMKSRSISYKYDYYYRFYKYNRYGLALIQVNFSPYRGFYYNLVNIVD